MGALKFAMLRLVWRPVGRAVSTRSFVGSQDIAKPVPAVSGDSLIIRVVLTTLRKLED